MKQVSILGIIGLISFLLASCALRSHPYPYQNHHNVAECWQKQVDCNPSRWLRGADAWFLTGDPMVRRTHSAAISAMKVQLPNFNSIKVNGSFEVQVFGSDHNSVFVQGPSSEVRQVIAEVRGNTLCLDEAVHGQDCMAPRHVIIRIGVANLNRLIQAGNGKIEARHISSNCLMIVSEGCGDIYLTGHVFLTHIGSSGQGSVTVLDASSNQLSIDTSGSGSVNVSGVIGIESIRHHGSGNINIIGAHSNCLRIAADGCGKVAIQGQVNIREIAATNHAGVFAYYICSDTVSVKTSQNAHVGLSGRARNIFVNTEGSSSFEGRYLYSHDAYVRAHQNSFINTSASSKIFVSSSDYASVYFYGNPAIISKFTTGHGLVVPILYDTPEFKKGTITEYPAGENIYRQTVYTGEGVHRYKHTRIKSKPNDFGMEDS